METAPWFEDFKVGDDSSQVPSITITEGYVALHQAIFGDRLRLPLDNNLSSLVTDKDETLVNPSVVCNLAIGQSTVPSQRVMGNLFYRGLVLQQPVFIGDTLTTKTKVVALKQNKIKQGRPASGMVALEMHVRNQHDDTVMLFWRCPMIPCQDPEADTGQADSFDLMPDKIAMSELERAVPDWKFERYRDSVGGSHFSDLEVDSKIQVEAQDTVTLAPELVRLTLNMAMTHTDATYGIYGKRLVYGGHTISMAAAQISRALPNMMTILGWYHCDHVAPVFEQDILRSDITIVDTHPLAEGGIVILHLKSFATRGQEAPDPGENIKVLDWRLATLFA